MKRSLLAILCASVCFGQAVPVTPALPQSVPSGVRPTPTGSVIAIHSGTDLQATFDGAACGSDLVLDAGITKTLNFVANKHCSAPNWILVEAAGCHDGTVPIPNYVSTSAANFGFNIAPFASPSLTNYATIIGTIATTDAALVTAGSYIYLGCLEVATPSSFNFSLVLTASVATNETLASQLSDHIILDRLYVHGNASDGTNQIVHGIVMAGSNISVVNSYCSNIYYSGGDAQCILGWAGPGPWLTNNNFLSASTEIVLYGGTGKTPGYSCTVAASPAPATTHATVNTCIDANGGSVATPPIGTQVMFYTSASMPYYSPLDSVIISGNTAGALTFPTTASVPLTGAGKIVWGLRPADLTLTKNYFWKNPCWDPSNGCYDGISRASKNFFETKYGQRELIAGNIFNFTYTNGQQNAFNFNSADQNGDCPWCFSSDVTFQNNIVKNIQSAVNVIGTEAGGSNGSCPPIINRILIQNNLWWVNRVPGVASGTNYLFALTNNNGGCTYLGAQATDSLQLIHNTFLGDGINGFISPNSPPNNYNYSNLVMSNNITEFDQQRWFRAVTPANMFCTDPCWGTSTLSGTYTSQNNAIINSGAINGGDGVSDATLRTRYGSSILSTIYDATGGTNYAGVPFANYSGVNTDYHNYRITTGPWINAASDGTNPGVNMALLDAAISGGSAPSVTCPALTGIVGSPYSSSLVGSGGVPAYTYSATGSVPGGLSLNTSTGLISGIPMLAGAYPFTAGITDAASQTASTPCSIAITSTTLSCDLNSDGMVNVLDVQLMTQQALGALPCTNNLKGSGTCNVVDIQRVTTAAFGGACVIGP